LVNKLSAVLTRISRYTAAAREKNVGEEPNGLAQ